MPDVFVALAEALPKPGDIFPIADRIRWLRACAAVADYIFRTDQPVRIEAEPAPAAVAPAPVFHKAEAGDPTPPLANLHLRTGMVEVDWPEAERLLSDGTEAQRLQALLLVGLRDDKFFTMGETAPGPRDPPARETDPPPPVSGPSDDVRVTAAMLGRRWGRDYSQTLPLSDRRCGRPECGYLIPTKRAQIEKTKYCSIECAEIVAKGRVEAKKAEAAAMPEPAKPHQPPPEAPVAAENLQDPPPDRIETSVEGPTKRDQLREMWARQIPVDQIAKTLGWEKSTVYGTARKIGLPMRKGAMANCGCGRPASHNGRCWFRRGLSGPPGQVVRARTPEPPTSLDTPETMPGAFDFAGRRVEPVPDMPTHATEVDGAIVHGDAPLTPTDRAAASEVIGAARRQLRDNGFRPPPPRPAAPERRSADQDQIDQAIAAGKMRRIPSPGEPGFSGIGELVRDPDTKKERRVATPNIDQITEILQYLRNEGDTVVGSSRDGNYTINGAAMKIDDVLARANLMRARAKKEPFRLEA